jgi:hypothetical protein
MKHIFSIMIVVGFLVAQPLFGQSRLVANTYRPPTAALFYFGGDGEKVLGQLQATVRSDEFMEIGLNYYLLGTGDRNAAALRRDLGMNFGATWALADSKGFLLAQGDGLPSAENISQGLEKAGIRSPIKVLREFIKRHPDHLDARNDLLSRLREMAEAKTAKLLKLEIKTGREASVPFDLMIYYQLTSPRFYLNIPDYKNLKLDEKDDLETWGDYAQELDYLFRTGDWRRADVLSLSKLTPIPLEVCSPLMKGAYRRYISQLEAALEERPNNSVLWRTYAWMRCIAEIRAPIRPVLDSMAPSPTTYVWPPPEVYGIIEIEAREQNRWGELADLLWDRRFDNLYSGFSLHFDALRFIRRYPGQTMATWITDRAAQAKTDYINPLLEALINTSRVDDAEFIIANFGRLRQFSDLPKEAAILAAKCSRPDLEDRWSKLEVQAKSETESIEDLEMRIRMYTRRSPLVLFANCEEDITQSIEFATHLNEAISTEGWDIIVVPLNKSMSELLFRRENWHEKGTMWALFNSGIEAVSFAAGTPSADDLINVLEQCRIEKTTEILRRFIREHPNHFDAKEELMHQLMIMATDKTNKKTNGGQTELSSEDDFLIWGEYATLFRQNMEYSFNNEPLTPFYGGEPSNNEMLKFSPTMRALAKDLLPAASSCVARQPTNTTYWSIWAYMADSTSATQFTNLVAALVVPPFADPLAVPPLYIRIYLLGRYRLNDNWEGIIALYGGFLEAGKIDSEIIYFTNIMIPLLEAYINLRHEQNLNEVLNIMKQHERVWARQKDAVEELFKKYGRILEK